VRRTLAAALLVSLAACAPRVQSPPAAPMAAQAAPGPVFPTDVAAARAAYIAAWQGTDRAALASFFAPDARVVFSDETYDGRAEIDRRWLAEDVGRVSELVMTPAHVTADGDRVTEAGTVTLLFRAAGGESHAERGTYEHVWARQPDGTWKLQTVHMDSHPAPPQ